MFFQRAALRRKLQHLRRLPPWVCAGGARRKLVIGLALLVLIAALLPLVVAKTPLLNMALAKAVPGGAVRVSAAGASLSWISGPSLAGIAITDAAGEPLIVADRVAVSRTPLNLILDSHDVGVIEISRPTIYIKLRPDGSNLEDAVNAVISALSPAAGEQPPAAGPTSPTLMAVDIVEGTIIVDDVATSRQWRVEGVNVQYDNRTTSGGPGLASIAGRIVQSAAAQGAIPGGNFSLKLQPIDANQNQLSLETDGISLAILEPLLRRSVAAAELAGTLSGQGVATWSNPAAGAMPAQLSTSGTLAVAGLDVSAPALQGDRIKFSRVELPWRVTSQPNGWNIDDLRLRCDAGQVALRGQVDPSSVMGRHSLEVRGAMDVARLAGMLPNALRIREGTSINSGAIELACEYRPNDAGQLIAGTVRATQLAAVNAGRPLRWDQPVLATFAMSRRGETFQLDSLKCDSQFLQIEAAGSQQQFTANATVDLNKLAEQLGQFIDLSGTKLSGTGSTKLDWQANGEQFGAKASADLAQLAVSLGDGKEWLEPQLAIRAELAGVRNPVTRQATRVDSAKLEINGQGDMLNAQLTSAVGLTSDAPVWPVDIKATGRIARWLTRVRPWFAPDPWQIDGQSELTAVVKAGKNGVEVSKADLVVSDFRGTAPGWNIVEPIVKLNGDARWDGTTSEVTTGETQLVTSTVTLRTKDVRYRAGDASISQLTGAAAFRADLARLAAWRAPAAGPAPYQANGEITGSVLFAQQGDRITGQLNAAGKNLALASLKPASATAYETIWQDPSVTVQGVANYQSSVDQLSFERLQIQSNTLQAAASGTVDKLSTSADVNVTGTADYDLAQVTPLLQPYVGTGIQLTGREQARFAMAGKLSNDGGPHAQLASAHGNDPYRLASTAIAAPGPHWSRRVRANLELPWSGANVYGLPVGPGRLSAALGDGAIRVEPLSLAVGEGTLTAAPHVRFDPEPAELTLLPGPLITNVRISPEVSEAMLKYVAPVLAGSTQSEGQFSMQLDGTRVPLADSKQASIGGKLSVHSVRVVPGAMANELIGVARQIEALARKRDPTALATKSQTTLLNIRDQQVNFKVIDGRVHHQNLEFQVGDITLRSQGSVGFDQTVQLTLLVPIQDAWVAKEPLLAGFKGQALQIPVGGTLTRPQMDQRAVASLSQQLLQGAAQQAIGGEFNKALDKIFKPR